MQSVVITTVFSVHPSTPIGLHLPETKDIKKTSGRQSLPLSFTLSLSADLKSAFMRCTSCVFIIVFFSNQFFHSSFVVMCFLVLK